MDMQKLNTEKMINENNLKRLSKYKSALQSEIQELRIWLGFNKEAGTWRNKKNRLDSLEFDLALVRDLMRKMKDQLYKSPIQTR